jgi:uncharacterized protein
MSETLPSFRYHPDPLATGAVKPSDVVCSCCQRNRGFIYTGPVYGKSRPRGGICPWCISDGSASEHGALFSDSRPLLMAGVSDEIVDEIHLRTPSFSSWQQEEWLVHCGDACGFHGDASVADVLQASPVTKSEWMKKFGLSEEQWGKAAKGYVPAGDSAFYKFICRHCNLVLLGWDLS